MSAKLSEYLAQMRKIEKLIEQELQPKNPLKSGHRLKHFYEFKNFYNEDNTKAKTYDYFKDAQLLPSPDNPYYMLTITFDSKVSMYLDEYGQEHRLEDSLKLLNEYRYYACLEKHKNGILHAHALIVCDHHEIQPILHQIKKKVTTSVRLEPAINIKPIKKTQEDVDRSFDYIVKQKDDHPTYKKLIFNK